MNSNNLISTIDSLKSFGQFDAIKTLQNNLRQAYEHANKVLDEVGYNPSVLAPTIKIEEEPENNVIDVSGDSKYSEYDPNWGRVSKYMYILKAENRFLHFREAAQIILELEGRTEGLSQETNALTNATRLVKKKGTIVKVQHGNSKKAFFWGSPKWLKEDGTVKKEFMYNVDILRKEDRGTNPLFEL